MLLQMDWNTQAPLPASRRSTRRTQIIGHRGAAGLAPENTLPALEIAAELGVDGVEIDVQRSADGVLVVLHDEDLRRVAGDPRRVGECTWEQLQALEVGRHFSPRFAGTRIPALAQVLAFLKDTLLTLQLELKDPLRYPNIEAETVALLREQGWLERTLVISFYHPSLRTIHALAPELALAELWFDRIPGLHEAFTRSMDVLYSLLNLERLQSVQARGQQVAVWTVNDVEAARHLLHWGVDAIATDYPDRLLALVEPG
ncbi:MAG: hypothetical protein HC915_04490 [Anaerolineae bacterium]|nr:hypothetical protein [Anaerolineae bacterium]